MNFRDSEYTTTQPSSAMVYRPASKKSAGSSDHSEYSFHLVGKKSIFGTSASVVGAIATGPVDILFNEVLGSAFETTTTKQPSKLGKPAKSVSAVKTKGPRRRKVSRTE